MSIIIPRGHSVEQYTRPITNVSNNRTATAIHIECSMAGISWISCMWTFGMLDEKSRKYAVMSIKTMLASAIRMYFNRDEFIYMFNDVVIYATNVDIKSQRLVVFGIFMCQILFL